MLQTPTVKSSSYSDTQSTDLSTVCVYEVETSSLCASSSLQSISLYLLLLYVVYLCIHSLLGSVNAT